MTSHKGKTPICKYPIEKGYTLCVPLFHFSDTRYLLANSLLSENKYVCLQQFSITFSKSKNMIIADLSA